MIATILTVVFGAVAVLVLGGVAALSIGEYNEREAIRERRAERRARILASLDAMHADLIAAYDLDPAAPSSRMITEGRPIMETGWPEGALPTESDAP